MGATSLKRKARRNRVVAKKRIQSIKLATTKPVIKKVDVEEIKAEFENTKKAPAKKEEKPVAKVEVVAEPVEEKKAEEAAPKEAEPKAEKKAAPAKKAPAKKKKEEE